MKKITSIHYLLTIFLLSGAFFAIPNNLYAESKANPLQLIGGIILTGAGIFLAVDGFKQIESSKPELDISNWYWSKEQIFSWWVDGYGTVENTGNVPLDDVKIYISYYDSSGNFLARDWTYLDTYWLEPLPKEGIDSWDTFGDTGLIEPTRAEISAIYTYEKEYKSKSAIEGAGGIAIGLIGLYLIYDYYRDLGYFAKLEEKGIDIKLVNKSGVIHLFASARLF